MQPDKRLQQAIDAAYRAFAPYPRPTSLDASPLRDADEILRTLTSAPLRDLTDEQISPYAGWALTTVGSVWDYKHFLPRILEQAVLERAWVGVEPAVIASKLDMASWRTWPAAEQAAVSDVFSAAWAQTREMHPDEADADAEDWLCGMAALGLDMAQPLAEWLSLPSTNALLQLASCLCRGRVFQEDDDKSIWWSHVDKETRRTIVAWLRSDAVIHALADGAGSMPDNDRRHLDQALSVVAPARSKRLQ